jgi:adenylate kinase family enzyme
MSSKNRKQKVINLFGGPGAGKSTMAAALFAELKFSGINCELVPEYAKEQEWEGRTGKIRQAQDYIFAKQHFRLSRLIGEVDVIITDAPLMLSQIYTPKDYLPSLSSVVLEAHRRFDNLNLFVQRVEAYQESGRSQTYDQAIELDKQIHEMLSDMHFVGGVHDGITTSTEYGAHKVLDLANRIKQWISTGEDSQFTRGL